MAPALFSSAACLVCMGPPRSPPLRASMDRHGFAHSQGYALRMPCLTVYRIYLILTSPPRLQHLCILSKHFKIHFIYLFTKFLHSGITAGGFTYKVDIVQLHFYDRMCRQKAECNYKTYNLIYITLKKAC